MTRIVNRIRGEAMRWLILMLATGCVGHGGGVMGGSCSEVGDAPCCAPPMVLDCPVGSEPQSVGMRSSCIDSRGFEVGPFVDTSTGAYVYGIKGVEAFRCEASGLHALEMYTSCGDAGRLCLDRCWSDDGSETECPG